MNKAEGKLLVLWTNADKETAIQMVFMYTKNAKIKLWWEEVTLLIWGAPTRLVAEDEEIQAYIRELQQAGVRTIACKKCAENIGVVEALEAQQMEHAKGQPSIEVFYTGVFLTDWLKSDKALLTV